MKGLVRLFGKIPVDQFSAQLVINHIPPTRFTMTVGLDALVTGRLRIHSDCVDYGAAAALFKDFNVDSVVAPCVEVVKPDAIRCQAPANRVNMGWERIS